MALNLIRKTGPEYVTQCRFSRSLVILTIGSMLLNGILCKESLEAKEKSIEENLFNVNNNTPLLRQSCITADDLTVFQAKRHFEQMIPKRSLAFEPLNDAEIMQKIEFFNQLENRTAKAFDDRKTRELMLTAFADASGAYMYGYFVPAVKYSYYGGFVSQFAAYEALRLLTKYQTMLRTNGSGRSIAGNHWQIDDLDPAHFYTQLKPLTDEQFKTAAHNCHHLSETASGSLQPYVEIDEDTQEMLLISLQNFHNGSVHNPKSKRAARMLVNYYIEIVRCFASNQDTLVAFQQTFAEWIASHTKYILANGQTVLYPAFEAVLQAMKSAENRRKLPKKSITAMNEHLPEDGVTDQDSDELDEHEDRQEMSALKKISIWIGCSLAVLLIVYIAFKMQQNRKIITNNRFTKRRTKSSERRRRSSSRRRLSRKESEEDECTVFDRLEADTLNDGGRNTAPGQRKFSMVRFIQRIQPRRWKSTAKGYKSVAVDEPSTSKQQRKPKEDYPQPGPSGISKSQRSRSCSCISCIERESLEDLDETDRPLRSA